MLADRIGFLVEEHAVTVHSDETTVSYHHDAK